MAKRRVESKILRIIFVLIALVVALFAVAYLATIGDYKVAKTVADDPALPYIEANGYRFHGETFGDPSAPVVIVVHGGPGWDYRSLLPLKAFANEFFVVFYDQRGSGLSPRVDASEISLDSALTDLDAIVERYRRGRSVRLIGHSWGAMLVTAYLGSAPQKVSHAVVAEPGFLNSAMFERSGIRLGPMWEAGYLLMAARRWLESLHIDAPDEDAAMDYFMGEVAARANPEYYCDDVIPEFAISHWRAGATAMSAMFASNVNEKGRLDLDLTVGLEHFTKPVLLLASECNDFIGIEQQKVQAGFYPESLLEIIPNSGHMIFSEQPEISVAVVRKYLK